MTLESLQPTTLLTTSASTPSDATLPSSTHGDTIDSFGPKALRSLPDDELMRRLTELASKSRRVEADLSAHIGEVEKRRLYARLAFPSMHAYCTRALHLSEAEAYRRITVARAARRYSSLLEMLRDGRLHLTGMALIVPLRTPENQEAVLARATHRSKREIQKLVAELAPKPDVPTVVRKLPQKRTAPAATTGTGWNTDREA